MFQADKENYLDLISSMREMHKVIAKTEDRSVRNDYLMDCQQAAISIGEALDGEEKLFPELYSQASDTVKRLEEYCEQVYRTSQCEDKELDKHVKHLEKMLIKIRNDLHWMQVRYRIVFFPYKADMWDSLESIYLAARADRRCEAIVCPIPYYEKDAEKDEWVYKYEGMRFPQEIPITYFEKIDLSDNAIDVAYIHNPYDGFNLVTSVHPDYYSEELRKHVRKLVYVPYYMDGAVFSTGLRGLPVMQNADWIVMASDYMKESCRQEPFYKKILPFGSPKFDRLIHMNQKGKMIPEDWKWALEDKKILMLNTSLNEFLEMNDLLLKKLWAVFQLVRDHGDVALIWRPHPLLESTIRAMRAPLMRAYQDLVRFFHDEKIGIFDTTSDADRAAVLSDGYLGSKYSSIIRLFEVLGKPIYRFSYDYKEWNKEAMPHDVMMESFKNGFCSRSEGDYFSMEEDDGLPLNVYISGFSQFDFTQISQDEKENISRFAANLDGSIGAKVHDYMMEVMEEER